MKECIRCESKKAYKWYSGPMCQRCYRKEWYETNKNTKRQKERKANYYKENKEKINDYSLEYSKNNRDKVNKNRREWYEKNKHNLPNRSEYMKKYYNERYKADPNFKLKVNLRNRLNMAIKKELKSGSAIKNLGCSIEELKKYLENIFQEGMSWDNWTTNGWHIDHIKPLAGFDLTNKEELKKACHYTNLQPMWAIENHSKGAN